MNIMLQYLCGNSLLIQDIRNNKLFLTTIYILLDQIVIKIFGVHCNKKFCCINLLL